MGGTLFLDEVDALPLTSQAKMLRFTELHEYRRLGETFVRRSDFRLITASNADLLARVRNGAFRSDLYFRLRVVPVEIPALCQRPDDIPALLAHFCRKYADAYGVEEIRFDAGANARLQSYAWPGNVRELQNCVRYLTCLGLERPVRVDDLRLLDVPGDAGDVATETDAAQGEAGYAQGAAELVEVPLKEAKSMVVEDFERMYIDKALREADGNVALAARRSGKHRRAFFELMRRYGIEACSYRGR
jgi:DNA-binding NtrC family response regulator